MTHLRMRAPAILPALTLAAALAPLPARGEGTPDLKSPAVIEAGQALFLAKHCSHCHGAKGNGGVNLTKRDLSDPAYVFEAIAEGRERGAMRMPAFRETLSDAEIWQAAAYVMSLAGAAQ